MPCACHVQARSGPPASVNGPSPPPRISLPSLPEPYRSRVNSVATTPLRTARAELTRLRPDPWTGSAQSARLMIVSASPSTLVAIATPTETVTSTVAAVRHSTGASSIARRMRSAAGRRRADRHRASPRKLLAPEARDEVDAADVLLQPPRELAQHRVAGVVAEAVVDRLELVEVDHHHREDPVGLRARSITRFMCWRRSGGCRPVSGSMTASFSPFLRFVRSRSE